MKDDNNKHVIVEPLQGSLLMSNRNPGWRFADPGLWCLTPSELSLSVFRSFGTTTFCYHFVPLQIVCHRE